MKNVIFDSEKPLKSGSKPEDKEKDEPITDLGAFLYGKEGNPHIKAAQRAAEKRYTFSIPVLSNGVPTYFNIQNATEDEAKEQMRKRFPKWSEEIINQKFKKFTMKESIELNADDLRTIVEQVVERITAARSEEDELKAAIAKMPDEIPGHIDSN